MWAKVDKFQNLQTFERIMIYSPLLETEKCLDKQMVFRWETNIYKEKNYHINEWIVYEEKHGPHEIMQTDSDMNCYKARLPDNQHELALHW